MTTKVLLLFRLHNKIIRNQLFSQYEYDFLFQLFGGSVLGA